MVLGARRILPRLKSWVRIQSPRPVITGFIPAATSAVPWVGHFGGVATTAALPIWWLLEGITGWNIVGNSGPHEWCYLVASSISSSRSLACRFGPRSLQLRNQIASIECLLEELERFTYMVMV